MIITRYSIDSNDNVDKVCIKLDDKAKEIELLRPDIEKLVSFINGIEKQSIIPHFVGIKLQESPFIDKNILDLEEE